MVVVVVSVVAVIGFDAYSVCTTAGISIRTRIEFSILISKRNIHLFYAVSNKHVISTRLLGRLEEHGRYHI